MNLKDTFKELMAEDTSAKIAGNPLFERMVVSPDFAVQLVAAGIVPVATFYYRPDKTMQPGSQVWELSTVRPEGGMADGLLILPAWTKEELDVMLASNPNVAVPKLIDVSFFSKADPTFHTWAGASRRIDMPKGADCSARVLLLGIQEGGIKVKAANKKYFDTYKIIERKAADLAMVQMYF